jgi:hypothetical protein
MEVTMDYYQFAVTNFQIHDTRSIHNDTLHLTHTVHVDGDLVALNALNLGDFNNGSYQTANCVHGTDVLGVRDLVINDPFSKVTFLFQLVNADHDSADTVAARTVATADQLAGIGSGIAGLAAKDGILSAGGIAAGAIAVGFELFANIYSWLNVDCDGPVAVDQFSGPRYAIDALADDDPTGTIFRQKTYPGTDSPEGCGGNSNYTVGWFVQHWRGWSEVEDISQNALQSWRCRGGDTSRCGAWVRGDAWGTGHALSDLHRPILDYQSNGVIRTE